MKKYNWYWSIWNLTQNTQKEVVQLQAAWGALAAVLIGSTWAMTSDGKALLVAFACALIDKAIACIYLEEKK